jgi:hypothetical protein
MSRRDGYRQAPYAGELSGDELDALLVEQTEDFDGGLPTFTRSKEQFGPAPDDFAWGYLPAGDTTE